MSSSNRKCIKNMQHEWETVEQYETHIVKQCSRCKTKHYKHRNTGIRVHKVVPIRI